MKKDVEEKMFPRTAHRIVACQLDWLVTSTSQRIKQGLILMIKLCLSLSQFLSFFLSLFLPPLLILPAIHDHREIQVESQTTHTRVLFLSLLKVTLSVGLH